MSFIKKIKNGISFLCNLRQGKLKIIDIAQWSELEARVSELQDLNDNLMMTHYSSKAANTIMSEIREIINCPVGNDIIDAIKKLYKNES